MRGSTRRMIVACLLGGVFVFIVAYLALSDDTVPTVRIGSKAFNEGVVLGEVVTQTSRDTGVLAEHASGMGGTGVLWQALLAGEIDAYVEYTGTIQREIYATQAPADLEAARELLRRDGVLIAADLGFNNTYALGMNEAEATRLGISRISDLAKHPELRLGFSNEFVERADGWPGLRDTYQLPHTNAVGLDHTLAYQALIAGKLDVTDLYSTDAEIKQYNLRTLVDDRDFFPEYRAVILVRSDLAQRAPDVYDALQSLEGRISPDAMIRMNAAVKIGLHKESDVAADFLHGRVTERVRTVGDRWNEAVRNLPRMTWQHLAMVFLSLGAGMIVAIPLGVIAHRAPRTGHGILASAGLLQTIPSIALLVLLIPLLGIGWWPAAVALFLYSLLPMIRNTHAGLCGIDPLILESANAMGLPHGARLRLVELPLAARSILAGIKVAAVINVGTATLGGFIGAGGYGEAIFAGIRRQDNVQILSGAIPAALMALVLQGLFEFTERVVLPRGLRVKRAT